MNKSAKTLVRMLANMLETRDYVALPVISLALQSVYKLEDNWENLLASWSACQLEHM